MISIRVSDQTDAEDKPFWSPCSSENFSSKSTMNLLREIAGLGINQIWRQIWSLPIQQCARSFLYLLAHNSVLCNINRVRRHLAQSATCPRFGSEETELHLLRDCSLIKVLWQALFGNNFDPSFFSNMDLQSWISMNISKGDDNGTLFA